MKYEALVIGVSMGRLSALKLILSPLPANLPLPIIAEQHIGATSDNLWVSMLNNITALTVKEVEEKDLVLPGYVYVAPADYYLPIERNGTFSLSSDAKVYYARPSVNVLFDSAADAFKNQLIGIVLSGGCHDGAQGLKNIQDCGGLALVQQLETTAAAVMSRYAIEATKVS